MFLSRGTTPGGKSDRMVEVDVTIGDSFSHGVLRTLFEFNYVGALTTRAYDVTPDAERFLVTNDILPTGADVDEIHIIQNWFEELKARVPLP